MPRELDSKLNAAFHGAFKHKPDVLILKFRCDSRVLAQHSEVDLSWIRFN